MKWKESDLKKYIQEKEYIDTLLIPLLPISLSSDEQLAKLAFQNELFTILTSELERELAGRVLLTPVYQYLKDSINEEEISRINEWVKEAQQQPFRQIFLMTHDSAWKQNEQSLNGTLLWFPTLKSGDIHSEEMNYMISDQVEQFVQLIKSYW